MSETKDEPVLGTQEGKEEEPDPRLLERLLARGTQPLGVIDVRHAEAQYARIMDWLAGRTPLLEHLSTRYGLTEAGGVRQFGLAFANAQEGHARRQGTDESISLSATPDSFTARADRQTFTSIARVPDDSLSETDETRRIGRRGVPTFSPAGHETLPGTSTTHEGQSEGRKSPLEHESRNPVQVRGLRAPSPGKEIPAAPDTAQATRTLAPSISLPSPSASSPRKTELSPLEETATPSATGARENPARVSELPADAREELAAPAFVARGQHRDAHQKASDEDATADVPLIAESSGANRGAREVPASVPVEVLERGRASGADDVPEVVSKELLVSTSGGRRFIAVEAGTEQAATEMPLARTRELPAALAVNGRESATTRDQSTLPLAAPVSEGVRTVKTSHRPQASAPGKARFEQVSTQVSTGAAETFVAERGGRAGVSPAAINVERLTEQVSRHLARRLLVERERRGLGRK